MANTQDIETCKQNIVETGNKIRELKNAKAEKDVITQAVNDLLALKAKYKELTGEDYMAPNTQKKEKKKKKETVEQTPVDPTKKSKKQLNKEKKKAAKKEKTNASKEQKTKETPKTISVDMKKSQKSMENDKKGKRGSHIPLTSLGSIPSCEVMEIRFVYEPTNPNTLPLVSWIVATLIGKKDLFHPMKNHRGPPVLPALIFPDGQIINGDCAIARYLIRSNGSSHGIYGFDDVSTSIVDSWMDYALQYVNESNLSNVCAYLNEFLKLRTYFVGHAVSMVDIVMYARLQAISLQSSGLDASYPHLFRWFSHCAAFEPFQTASQLLKQLCQGSTTSSHAKNTSSKGDKSKKNSGEKKVVNKDSSGSCPPLAGAVEGQVCTRFPPEPSGYLHIGHVKACMLNDYYAKRYNGKLIVRFDDTNPSKEKQEFESSILEDLQKLGIKPSVISYTSDHFETILKYAYQIIEDGLAYMDNTPQETMREERMDGIESKCRNKTPEENMKLFKDMCAADASKEISEYCLRAKIDMQAKNKTLRDPVLFRRNPTPHHRTGSKYVAYPTYDFACPIVDSIEGVTHALRTTEYNDRDEQYQWVLKTLRLRPVRIHAFARMNFVYSVLSKRKLQWFVSNNIVDGWDDPRFPTVRGVLRRGVQVNSLRSFILSQGASRRITDMEWDKFWTLNKRVIDPIAVRYFAIHQESAISLELTNIDNEIGLRVALHPKDPSLGEKVMRFGPKLLIEQEDAALMKEGEEITLMRYGNVIIDQLIKDSTTGNITKVIGRANPEGDFKKTSLKITWLADKTDLVPIRLVEYDHLITKPKLEEGDDFKDFLTPVTKAQTMAWGCHGLRNLAWNAIVQLERRGYFRVDQVHISASRPLTLIQIPDGKSKAMSTLSTKLAHR